MNVWNKYGEIKDGKITGAFRMTDEHINYAGCYEIFNTEPVGDKFDQPAEATEINGTLVATINGIPYGYLPSDWTQFTKQVRERGPLKGLGSVFWRNDKFIAKIDLENA